MAGRNHLIFNISAYTLNYFKPYSFFLKYLELPFHVIESFQDEEHPHERFTAE